MSPFKLEFEMRIPVANWLLSRGLAPVCEVQSLGNCDLVGVRFDEKPVRLAEMVAVELKLNKVAAVLRQCECHSRRSVTEVWAAMLPDVARKHHGRFGGIGMLAVYPDRVEIVRQAARREGCDLSRWKTGMRRRRNEFVRRMQNQNMMRDSAPSASAAARKTGGTA